MLKRIFSSQLRINMASGTVTMAVNAVVLAVAYPVYLHFLGYEKYGLWLILATVLTFAQLGNLGIDRAVTKLVAEEYGRGGIVAIQKCLTAALLILVAMGGIALLAIVAFRADIVELFKLRGENREIVLSLLPYVGCLTVYVLAVEALNAAVSGLGRMDLANYVRTGGRIVKVAVASVLLHRGYGIKGLLIASVVSYVGIHAASMIMIRRTATIRLMRWGNVGRGYYRRLLSFGGPVFGGSLLDMLFHPFNKVIVSRYVGVEAVPIYDITYTGSMIVRTLIESGLRALMPEVSRIGAKGMRDAKQRISVIHKRSIWVIFWFGIPLYVVLASLAPMLLRLWLGTKFTVALPGVFRIMLLATFLSLLCVPAYYTLMGLGRTRQCFLSHVIQGLVNVAVVVTSLLFLGTLSIGLVASAVMLAMAATSCYTIGQSRLALKQLHSRVSQPVSKASSVAPATSACDTTGEYVSRAEQEDIASTVSRFCLIAERTV